MSLAATIAENLAAVRRRIAAACARANRAPADVTLVGVTKYAQLEWVRELVRQGEFELGESRPQQLIARATELEASASFSSILKPQVSSLAAAAAPIHWHLIGSLQRNKVRMVLPAAARIHSVDSIKLLETIDRIAGELNLTPRLLLEVNLTGEEAKHGFTRTELFECWEQASVLPNVRIDGLMTMAALASDPESARPVFRGLRLLRDELRSRSSSGDGLPQLSMGMSGDFEVAIEEGATLVRIGTALWENLE